MRKLFRLVRDRDGREKMQAGNNHYCHPEAASNEEHQNHTMILREN